VLSIGKLCDPDYYLSRVAAGIEDYYLGHGEAPGRWVGAAAAADLGLSGTVDADDLRAVLDGTDPHDGSRLAAGNRRLPGYDLCFSPPKSVSVLFGLGDPYTARAVVACHEEAVDAALGWLERHAALTRLGHNGVESAATTGFVAAAFRHRSSRAGDPQLHTHVLVANLARGTDGKWRTLDGRALYANAKAASFLYAAHLRWALTRDLGVAWGPVTSGHGEIEGIPETVRRLFSRRRTQIETRMAERGETSARAAQVAALDTRRAKRHDLDGGAMAHQWRARAAAEGFGPDALAAVLGRAALEPLSPEEWEVVAAELSSAEGLTAQVSTFVRRDVVAGIAERRRAGAPVAEVEALAADYLARPEVVALRGGRFSTTDMLRIERAALAEVERRRGTGAGVVPEEALAAAVSRRPSLEPEQVAMARRLTTSGDGVEVVAAPAGAGKTFALDACREAWERAGRSVLGAALAARTAAELQADSGITSSTVAALLADLDRPESDGLPRGGVLVVDEAGMVGTRTLARLLDHAADADAKVVLVGDARQLPEIEAGGLFAHLAARPEAVRLVGNRRQREAWERAALADFRDGALDAALAAYEARGRIVRGASAPEVREAMAADWWAATVAGESALMLAGRRSDADDLNARARVRMAAAGRLSGPELVVDDRPYQAGDRVLTLRNDRRLGVLNGTRGTVLSVDPEARALTLATDDGREVSLPARYLDAGHVAHGYALTAHKAQGSTVERAMLLGTDDLYREMGYVGMSRGRAANHLYVVGGPEPDPDLHHAPPAPEPPDVLVFRALATSRAKTLATDADRPDAAARLRALYAERRRLQIVLVHAPPDPAADRRALTEVRQRAVAKVTEAEARVASVRPSRLRRRPTAEQAWAESGVIQARAILEDVDAELAAVAGRENARWAWLDTHAEESARLPVVEQEIPVVLAERMREVERRCPRYVEDVLGRPPADERARESWRRGVEAVERYRAVAGITDRRVALGHRPTEPGAQRLVWDAASRELAEAKQRIAFTADQSRSGPVTPDLGFGP
jgi:conjugative relaxase-like TrwC/TraI family protein